MKYFSVSQAQYILLDKIKAWKFGNSSENRGTKMIKCSVWSCSEQSKGSNWKYSEIVRDFGKVSRKSHLAGLKEKKNVVQKM